MKSRRPPVILRKGAYYLRREGGGIVGPMEKWIDEPSYRFPWTAEGEPRHYSDNGTMFPAKENPMDLVQRVAIVKKERLST